MVRNALLAFAISLAGTSSVAQPIAPTASPLNSQAAAPIPSDLFQKFLAVTAISSCALLSEKVDYKTIVRAGVTSLAGIIYTDYGSKISGINSDKPLEVQQLSSGVGLDLSLQINARCPKLVPEEDQRKLKEFLEVNSPKK